jgi:hypothetical protein
MRHKRDKLPVHTGQPLEMAKLPLGQFTGKGGQTPEKNTFYITQVKELIKYTCADKSLVIIHYSPIINTFTPNSSWRGTIYLYN